MIKIENTEVVGYEPAIRGMRNPMNSWAKSDSGYEENVPFSGNLGYVLGENDLNLAKKLAANGSVHAKYRRMIVVYADVIAPLYWWKEYDTYKIGTVTNSCSTMHKIMEKKFTIDDFSCEHLVSPYISVLYGTIQDLNTIRDIYLNWPMMTEDEKSFYPEITSKEDLWWQIIQLLPSSYNQRRTVMLSYEVLANIYPNRKDHKLDEWRNFCKWIKELPYSELITLT